MQLGIQEEKGALPYIISKNKSSGVDLSEKGETKSLALVIESAFSCCTSYLGEVKKSSGCFSALNIREH